MVPQTVDARRHFHNPAGSQVGVTVMGQYGVDVEHTYNVTAAGTYFYKLVIGHANSVSNTTSFPNEVPRHYTQPYSFIVTRNP